MLCPKCGQMNADNVGFCATCGQKLAPLAPNTATQEARPSSAIPLNVPQPGAVPPTIPANPPQSLGYGAQPPQAPYGAPPTAPPPNAYTPNDPPAAGPRSLIGEPLPPPAGPAAGYAGPNAAYAGVCRVCGNPLTPRDYNCPRCATPVGMVANPNDPTSASYLPVGGVGYLENTSGQKGSVPPEIQGYRWSWGAFSLNWLWLCFHGLAPWGIAMLVIGFIPFVGIINLGASIYLGINGYKLAWQNRRYDSIEQFKAVETKWMQWGIALWLLGVVCGILLLIFVLTMGGGPRSYQ
jgi:hypothetical protein